MAQKTDRRILRTRHALQEALVELILEKGYESVTVQDVIDRANVGRSTFYVHFLDKEDLLISEFEVLWSHFEEHLSGQPVTNDSLWSLSTLMFQHAQSYHRIYRAVVGKQSDQLMQTQIRKLLSEQFYQHFNLHHPNADNLTIPLDIQIHGLVTLLMSLLTWWLDNDLPYPPEKMGQMYKQLLKPGIDALWGLGSNT